jgi:NAD(P)-dependent dehydrogenase (short-subunit alcohol dehydrogenase family)
MNQTRIQNEGAVAGLACRTAVVTGANSGVGFETALLLAARGARVVLACRDPGRGVAAQERIARAVPGADTESWPLDLADLASVGQFAARLASGALGQPPGIDILVNNAGLMGGPRRRTADGFEAHLGTNHLGHFALTGLLLPALLTRPGARVVTVTSNIAGQGRIDFGDLHRERRYRPFAAYAGSKLANLLFAIELDRRVRAVQAGLVSVASHPGAAVSNLLARGRPGRRGVSGDLLATVQALTGQPARQAALTSVYAATAPGLTGGEYIGPDGLGHLRGRPARVRIPRRALDPVAARRLWEVSAELTAVHFDLLVPSGDAAAH